MTGSKTISRTRAPLDARATEGTRVIDELLERRRGRPVVSETKTAISLRVSDSVLAAFKATSPWLADTHDGCAGRLDAQAFAGLRHWAKHRHPVPARRRGGLNRVKAP